MNTPNPKQMNAALIAAAQLIMQNMNRAADNSGATARSLSLAILPAFGLCWNKEVLLAVNSDNAVNRLLAKLRNSPLPRIHYDKLANLFKAAYLNPYSLLPEWAEWRHLADTYLLDRRYPNEEIAQAVTLFMARGVPDPGALALLDAGAVEVLADAKTFAGAIRTMWRLARNTKEALSSNEHLALPVEGLTADSFKKSAKIGILTLDRTRATGPLLRKNLPAPASFRRMGPSQKIGVLRKLKTFPARINRFIRDNSQRNLLKQIRGSLPSVVSALNCYLQFCLLQREDPFPITERRIIDWSAFFSDNGTFYNYTLHLQKVCFSLGLSSAWLTPAVRHIAKGLKKCQDKSFKFPNFIRSRLLIRLIKSESIEAEFAQACLLSFLFSFRVPSETLELRRAFRNDRLTEFSPQKKKALMGIRLVGKQVYLVAKFSFRKNHTGGVIMKRPCFCGLDNDLARLTCPVHSLWPAVQKRVHPGDRLFSAVNRRNFNRRLKAILAKMGVPQAHRFSSHAFRRGSAQEMNETGSPLSVVAGAGMWRSNAVKTYIDLDAHVEANVRHLFKVDMESDSDMEVQSHWEP